MSTPTNPPKVAFIGAGSTVFMKQIVGDILASDRLAGTKVALMDIDAERLAESEAVAKKMAASTNSAAEITSHDSLEPALDGADFVVLAFQIGGYKPCTVTDFDIPNEFGLQQTIGDTLGIGGIMRGLRTVPKIWEVCEAMRKHCPNALLMNYVNPMAINTWGVTAKYPDIRYVGLCHSVQTTLTELAHDLDIPKSEFAYRSAGINHMAFFLELDHMAPDGTRTSVYPRLQEGYANGTMPKPPVGNQRCPNFVRYEVMKHLGLFVTESSEHFAEYVPWFIKSHRPDLISKFQIPLNEYPIRCEEQIERWKTLSRELAEMETIEVKRSKEYACAMIEAEWGGDTAFIHGNIANDGHIPQLPKGAAIEVPCHMDTNGLNPQVVDDIPPHLIALMRTQINVQELTTHALLNEDRESIFHAAYMDPRAASSLDMDQIRSMTERLIEQHAEWLPAWCRG